MHHLFSESRNRVFIIETIEFPKYLPAKAHRQGGSCVVRKLDFVILGKSLKQLEYPPPSLRPESRRTAFITMTILNLELSLQGTSRPQESDLVIQYKLVPDGKSDNSYLESYRREHISRLRDKMPRHISLDVDEEASKLVIKGAKVANLTEAVEENVEEATEEEKAEDEEGKTKSVPSYRLQFGSGTDAERLAKLLMFGRSQTLDEINGSQSFLMPKLIGTRSEEWEEFMKPERHWATYSLNHGPNAGTIRRFFRSVLCR